MILPAWITWSLQTDNALDHIYVEVECPSLFAHTLTRCFDRAVLIDSDAGVLFVDTVTEIAHKNNPAPTVQDPEQENVRKNNAPYGNQLCAGIHQAMASLAPRISQYRSGTVSQTLLLQEIMHYIHEHLSRDLRIPIVAALYQRSPKYITNLFNSCLRQSPAAYIREQRLIHACKLLRSSSLSIEHIAKAAGFANRDYFSRLMQQHMHIAPAAYRTVNQS